MQQRRNKKRIRTAVLSSFISALALIISIVHVAHADLNPLTAKHRTVYVQETAGFDRTGEPVDTEIKFYQPMPSKDKTGAEDIVTEGIRVFRITDTNDWDKIRSSRTIYAPSTGTEAQKHRNS